MAGTLKHPFWSGDSRLQAAAENRPALGTRDFGPPVKLLQEALEALGYPLPKSTRLVSPPGGIGPPRKEYDGVYGMETLTAVQWFQRDFGLKKDCAAGKDTLQGMESQLVARKLLYGRPSGGGGSGSSGTTPKPKRIQVWFNIFLPGTIAGVTIPSKATPGTTVITDSFPDKMLAFDTKTIETNNRSFDATLPSLVIGTKSLLTATLTVEFSPTGTTFTQGSKLAIVLFYNNVTHFPIYRASHTLANSGGGFTVKARGAGWMRFDANFSVTNPFGSPFVGRMDMAGELEVEASGKITFDLKLDDFPAYEGYAEDGTTKANLFAADVPPGKTPKSLIGAPTRAFKGVKTL